MCGTGTKIKTKDNFNLFFRTGMEGSSQKSRTARHGHTFLVKFVHTKDVIKLKKTRSNCPPLVINYIMVVTFLFVNVKKSTT